MAELYDVIIIGSGPAGYTAALYASRANLSVLMFQGYEVGGQLMTTSDVENYPGFAEGILGPTLMEQFEEQARRFGTEMIPEDVTAVDFSKRPFTITTDSGEYKARSVIIATGASAKWLNLPSEQALMGRGVSSCATCDGFFFRGKDVAVVGGGDTALEEAIFLTKFARSVTLIHRRKELRGSKIMQDRAQNNPKISFIWDSVVCEVLGSDHVEGVKIENVLTKQTSELAVDGLFVAIGYTPNTKILEGQIELDERGYVRVHHETRTNVEGVFVAGDVEDYHYRQAITAAGAGCRAAMDAEVYIEGVA